jgi:hypothetical protein
MSNAQQVDDDVALSDSHVAKRKLRRLLGTGAGRAEQALVVAAAPAYASRQTQPCARTDLARCSPIPGRPRRRARPRRYLCSGHRLAQCPSPLRRPPSRSVLGDSASHGLLGALEIRTPAFPGSTRARGWRGAAIAVSAAWGSARASTRVGYPVRSPDALRLVWRAAGPRRSGPAGWSGERVAGLYGARSARRDRSGRDGRLAGPGWGRKWIASPRERIRAEPRPAPRFRGSELTSPVPGPR